MKVYAGAPAAARNYVEMDRGRADDYYLAEGVGIARRFTAEPGRVVELAPLAGDAYQTWVAGREPETGEPRGRLRPDVRAVRFVEVVVNGPKSWSLAAALHTDIAQAYDAAQDRAASQIIGWLSEHATTRVGPAGGQVQIAVERLEAVTVRHYTSRAGDPHRHLHLQINARVFASGKWRGLHTVGVRDSLAAINGIGHAAVATDPQFRATLTAHGYTLDEAGEIRQLAEYVGRFSARAAQIGRNVDRYEREWTQAHPGEQPGPALRRRWDARAWAEGRPDKVVPRPGAKLSERWLAELAALGYRDRNLPMALTATPVGGLDRDGAAEVVLGRLGAARSAWNGADVRGEVEHLLAAQGVIADAAIRFELAEDLTARALERCVALLPRDGVPVPVPEHIRGWTSQPVLDVEDELTARLAARRFDAAGRAPVVLPVGPLDTGQSAVVAALAGERSLLVVEGAAGAGKTTTLAATRRLLADDGRRLVVVTPTLKAARVAAAEVGARTGSAAWLVFQHGWRWTGDGDWTRLAVGEGDPVSGRPYAGPTDGARLRPGDLLVVDEAGMLDQDTARALLSVADECQVRVALLGDRHQLAAVGRGGVLDLAAAQVDAGAHLTLGTVHRFTRTLTDGDGPARAVPDTTYAALTLAMRTGEDPGGVFDTLCARRRIRIHPGAMTLTAALAATVDVSLGAGERVAVVVNTREQAAELNAAIRDRLVASGRVDDLAAVTTRSGQRIGAGDRIATRRNDRSLGVANRDTWVVVAVGRRGELLVTPADTAPPAVTPGAVSPSGSGFPSVTPGSEQHRVLPADYVARQVELAYASTAHAVQGDTVTSAHLVVGEHTGAASAYVGMTRGREANTAHLIATDLAEAREQWIAVFARERADLGPGHAAELAAQEAARHGPARPLEQVLAELHEAWTAEQQCLARLDVVEPECNALRQVMALYVEQAAQPATAQAEYRAAAHAADRTRERADALEAVVTAEAERLRDTMLADWDAERGTARAAAVVVLAGGGRLGFRRAAVGRAMDRLTAWADRWRPHVPELPTDPRELAKAASSGDHRPTRLAALDSSARRSAADPDLPALHEAARAAHHSIEQAGEALTRLRLQQGKRPGRLGSLALIQDPAARLAEADRHLVATHQQLTEIRARIGILTAEPALRSQPPDRLAKEHDAWQARRDAELTTGRSDLCFESEPEEHVRRRPRPDAHRQPSPHRAHGHGHGRGR
jgi:conjugative relaxase-like TrwC/TraI family protein